MNRIKIEYRKTDALKFYDRNPRRNDETVDRLVKSIQEFGFKVPLVVEPDGTVVCGHARLKAARKMGLAEVPCVVANDLTEEQIKAFRIADNRIAEFSEWDYDALKGELVEIDIKMVDYGFNDMKRIDESLAQSPAEPMPEPGEFNDGDRAKLPDELREEKLEPDGLEPESGESETPYERIVLIYEDGEADDLCAVLGLERIDKVVYTLEELLDGRNQA